MGGGYLSVWAKLSGDEEVVCSLDDATHAPDVTRSVLVFDCMGRGCGVDAGDGRRGRGALSAVDRAKETDSCASVRRHVDQQRVSLASAVAPST